MVTNEGEAPDGVQLKLVVQYPEDPIPAEYIREALMNMVATAYLAVDEREKQ